MSANTPQELSALLERLQARWKGRKPHVPYGLSTAEHIMVYAKLLGAEDPYQAILHPEMLDRVLSNTLPEWVLPTGIEIDLQGVDSLT